MHILVIDRVLDFLSHQSKLPCKLQKVFLVHDVASCAGMSRFERVLVHILMRVSVIVAKDEAIALDAKPEVFIFVNCINFQRI